MLSPSHAGLPDEEEEDYPQPPVDDRHRVADSLLEMCLCMLCPEDVRPLGAKYETLFISVGCAHSHLG